MAAITDALDTLATAASDYLTAAESVADALSELDSADLDDIKDAHVRSVIAHLVAQAEVDLWLLTSCDKGLG
jgi:hypothetical protein